MPKEGGPTPARRTIRTESLLPIATGIMTAGGIVVIGQQAQNALPAESKTGIEKGIEMGTERGIEREIVTGPTAADTKIVAIERGGGVGVENPRGGLDGQANLPNLAKFEIVLIETARGVIIRTSPTKSSRAPRTDPSLHRP